MPPPLVPVAGSEPEPASETDPPPQMLASLPVIDKIKLALRGTRDQRSVLVRDPNKVVAVAVMGSPKLDPTEVEAIARMTSVQEEVLRIIGTSRHWVKNYPIVAALVGNAKTPLGIAMGLVKRLNERDLKLVARDRNVSDGVRAAAHRVCGNGAGTQTVTRSRYDLRGLWASSVPLFFLPAWRRARIHSERICDRPSMKTATRARSASPSRLFNNAMARRRSRSTVAGVVS